MASVSNETEREFRNDALLSTAMIPTYFDIFSHVNFTMQKDLEFLFLSHDAIEIVMFTFPIRTVYHTRIFA